MWKQPVAESSNSLLAQKPHFDTRTDGCQDRRMSFGGTLTS